MTLLRRPRLYQRCSAIEEEDDDVTAPKHVEAILMQILILLLKTIFCVFFGE